MSKSVGSASAQPQPACSPSGQPETEPHCDCWALHKRLVSDIGVTSPFRMFAAELRLCMSSAKRTYTRQVDPMTAKINHRDRGQEVITVVVCAGTTKRWKQETKTAATYREEGARCLFQAASAGAAILGLCFRCFCSVLREKSREKCETS